MLSMEEINVNKLYNLVGVFSVTERTQPSKDHPNMSMSKKYKDALRELAEARQALREAKPEREITSTTYERAVKRKTREFDRYFFYNRR